LTFSQNRDRLFNQGVARLFFERVRALAEWSSLTSDEHFTADGTLIDAWASHKTRLIGQVRLAGQVLLATATYNLIRMGTIGG